MYNPFDGVKPSLGPFSSILNSPITVALALVWAVALAFAAFHLIMGIVHLIAARQRNRGAGVEAAQAELVMPVVGIVLLAAVPTIYAIASGGFRS